MFRKLISIATICVAGLFGIATVELSAGCNRCGCNHGCKVCKLVPDVKKETTFEYRVECEDFCLYGRSKCIGTKQVCDECSGRVHCEKVWQPTCGCVKTRAKLVKVPVVKEKHGWKCVVVSSCGRCGNCCADAREATADELQMALQEARNQGLLQVSYEEPIFVRIPEELPAVPAAETVQPTTGGSVRFLGLLPK